MLIFDAGFGLALLQEEGMPRYVVRCATPATFCHARHTHDPCRGTLKYRKTGEVTDSTTVL